MTRNVNNIIVVEASDDVNDGRNLSYVAEKLISESFTLGCTLDESRNIAEFYRRVYRAL